MQHAVALPGTVQKRPLRGRLAEPVNGLNPTGTGAGALESESGRDECLAQTKVASCQVKHHHHRPGVVAKSSLIRRHERNRAVSCQQEALCSIVQLSPLIQQLLWHMSKAGPRCSWPGSRPSATRSASSSCNSWGHPL